VVERSDTTGYDARTPRIPEGCQQQRIAMASTFLALQFHIVFSTKDRMPFIDPSWRERFHEYLGGTVAGLGGFAQGVGGIADHVHLLVGLKATHCLADFMRELKKASSVWVHEEIGMREFAWQEGYGAFTVSPTARPQVQKYIANQAEHHRVKSFREELVEFLKKAGVKYEDRYLD
jgi:REP element-mobilizing transposase RayT